MKRVIAIMLAVVTAFAGTAGALNRFQHELVELDGTTYLDANSVTVYKPGTSTAATIWTEESMSTTVTNPIVTGLADGSFEFYGDFPYYDLQITSSANAAVLKYSSVRPTKVRLFYAAAEAIAGTISATGSIETASNLTVAGDANLAGDVNLGSAAGDKVNLLGTLTFGNGATITNSPAGYVTITSGSDNLIILIPDNNTAALYSGTGVASVDYNGLNFADVGKITLTSGSVVRDPVVKAPPTTSYNIADANCYGGSLVLAAAGDFNLPEVVAGMELWVFSGAYDVNLNPADDDVIVCTGLTPAAGDKIGADGAAGNYAHLKGLSATTWFVTGKAGTWTDND